MSGNGVTRMTAVSEANEGVGNGVGANEEVNAHGFTGHGSCPTGGARSERTMPGLRSNPEGKRVGCKAGPYRRICALHWTRRAGVVIAEGRWRETDFPAIFSQLHL